MQRLCPDRARGQARREGEEGSAVQSLTPKTLAELAQALSAATKKAKIIAGGTDFIIKERAGKFAPDLLIYPGFIPELNTVTKENGVLRIGAAVPMNGITAALKDDKAFCAIADAASDVGSPQIRAKGTMAGNLCNASPAGDMLPVSWLYDAQLELMNADGTASVTPVNGFITGPQKTILRPDQAVTAILIGLKQFEGFVSAFHKIGSRERVSISREGLAAAVRLDENGKVEQARLSLGAVGGTPIRVTDAEEYMRGRVLDEKLVEEITPMVAETIHNNCRPANRLYKTEAARGLTADTFAKLMSRL
ncbi:MAG TPA: carbon monoxide dehydrogenase [Oscillibacter sp.]|nr:carbon monoxide dehydrogenase [Oscillibacter sp.]